MESSYIRELEIQDLDRVLELEKICFNENIAYNYKQLKYLIENANSYCLAELNNQYIRGFIIVLYKNGSKVAGIETLNVDPIFRGTGIGKKLLMAAEKDMYSRFIRRIRLEVSTGNTPALNLYKKSGFRITEILKDYYKHQCFGTTDAFRMVKEITT